MNIESGQNISKSSILLIYVDADNNKHEAVIQKNVMSLLLLLFD